MINLKECFIIIKKFKKKKENSYKRKTNYNHLSTKEDKNWKIHNLQNLQKKVKGKKQKT